ncbi:MAG: hypothetical protein IH840_14730 [Candidatus Heimdallarchaeota archaeon]|nr:hypothetical protein [Candidatus Heimdallarchaeota archaeon]
MELEKYYECAKNKKIKICYYYLIYGINFTRNGNLLGGVLERTSSKLLEREIHQIRFRHWYFGGESDTHDKISWFVNSDTWITGEIEVERPNLSFSATKSNSLDRF